MVFAEEDERQKGTMWTSIVDLSPRRIFLTQLLGRFWRGAYFSSFAPLQVQNIPRQTLPSQSWVRVRNRLAGICGSDLHFIYADGDIRVAPAALPGRGTMYLGHEVVGEIIEKGDDAQLLNVGDRVVLQHGPNCLSSNMQPLCRSCASGHYGLCEQGKLPGPHPIGGGWSEEMLLHEQQLFRISPDMTDEQAVMLEPSAVAVHAVLRHPPQNVDRVLIIGAGTIGLLTLQVVHALAPQAEISVLARYPFQVEQATRMGAAHIIYSQDSYEGVQRATEGKLYQGMFGNKMLLGGYDVIYDTIGSRDTLHSALRWARARSTVVLVGLSLHMMNIDLTPVWYQEVNLLGTLGQGMEQWPLGSQQQRSTFSVTAEMIEQGQIHPEKLVTHHFALDKYQHALMTAADKGQSRAIKVVFDYALLPASVVPNVRASAAQRRPATVDVLTPQVTARIFDEQTKPVEPLQEAQEPQEAQAAAVEPQEDEIAHDEQRSEDTVCSLPKIPIFDLPTTPISSPAHKEPSQAEEQIVFVPAIEEQTLAQPVHQPMDKIDISETTTIPMPPSGVDTVEPAQNEQEVIAEAATTDEEDSTSYMAFPELEYVPEADFVAQEMDVDAIQHTESRENRGVEDGTPFPTGPLPGPPDEEYVPEEGGETKSTSDTLLKMGVPGKTITSKASGAEQAIRRPRKKSNNRR